MYIYICFIYFIISYNIYIYVVLYNHPQRKPYSLVGDFHIPLDHLGIIKKKQVNVMNQHPTFNGIAAKGLPDLDMHHDIS